MTVDGVRALVAELERLDGQVARAQASQISSETYRGPARAVVDSYFRSLRRGVEDLVGIEVLQSADTALQTLLHATQQRPRRPQFRALVRSAVAALRDLERVLLMSASRTPRQIDPIDERIISTLKSLLPSAGLAYQQAVLDLAGGPRLSWRGPATDLREALRETLDHLAPDNDVEARPGYKREPDAKGPTMRQKVRYVLSRRGVPKTAGETSERAAEAVEEAVGLFVRSVYSRSSVSTHTPTDKNEVLRIYQLVQVCLRELLEL